jgi:hypothetical protein
MFRSYDYYQAENILIARITELTTDLLFYNIDNIYKCCHSEFLKHS